MALADDISCWDLLQQQPYSVSFLSQIACGEKYIVFFFKKLIFPGSVHPGLLDPCLELFSNIILICNDVELLSYYDSSNTSINF
jgi:hypothetical protein